MNLAAIDLNLLVAFEALMTERSVTRAGRRIGLGQPAMSAALARLRAIFDDELLVRVPGAAMRPTTRATDLNQPVAEILARIRQVFDAQAIFDPTQAHTIFRIATGDHAGALMLPPFFEKLAREAPAIDIRLLALDKRDAFDLLDRGEIDLIFGSFRNVPKRIRRQRLYADRYVCIARRNHPELQNGLTLRTYAALPHLLVTLAADDRGIVDEALARHGLRRRVAVTVSNSYLVPRIVARTDMISHLPHRIAADLARGFDLVMLPPPLDLADWSADMYWGGASHAEPGARWIRARLAEIGQHIDRRSEGSPPADPPPADAPI